VGRRFRRPTRLLVVSSLSAFPTRIGVEAIGDQDGDLRGRGQLAELGQHGSGTSRLVGEFEDVYQL